MPVRADRSEQTGHFWRGVLKRQALNKRIVKTVTRGVAAVHSIPVFYFDTFDKRDIIDIRRCIHAHLRLPVNPI